MIICMQTIYGRESYMDVHICVIHIWNIICDKPHNRPHHYPDPHFNPHLKELDTQNVLKPSTMNHLYFGPYMINHIWSSYGISLHFIVLFFIFLWKLARLPNIKNHT